MLKEIIRALRGTKVLAGMIADVGEMLAAGKWMFEQAGDALLRKADWADVSEDLYARDRRINEIEQRVRERIVGHLATGNTADLSACLVLMNVVKDAERIGDYCKNLFEVARFYHHSFTHPEYSATLDDIRAHVLPLFDQARTAFMETDGALARKILASAAKARGRCDVVIRQLLTVHEQLAPDEAVAYVLLARFYKRVAAHLANIATSIVSPVPMLDYRGQLPEDEA